jgi:hypothetical protein
MGAKDESARRMLHKFPHPCPPKEPSNSAAYISLIGCVLVALASFFAEHRGPISALDIIGALGVVGSALSGWAVRR